MKKYTVGIDFGTLSARAAVVCVQDGRELSSAVFAYPHGVIDAVLPSTGEKLPPSWALQDPQDYLDALAHVIPEAIAASGVNRDDIIGIAADFTCCTVFPMYEDGTPLCFTGKYRGEKHAWCKLWKHHAAQPYADRINELYARRGDHWMDDNFGGRISSESFLPKIWETLDGAPEVYEAADRFIEACDWINLQLTGKLTRGYIIASYKECYRPGEGYVPADFLRLCDPRLERLFEKKAGGEIVHSGSPAGFVTAEAAEKYGLPAGIPVAAAVPDAHIGGFPLGIAAEGDMFGIFGTSNCYFLMSRERREVPGICGCVRDGILPGYWGYEAGLCCFGDHFAWAAEQLTTEAYAREAREKGLSDLQLLLRKAAALRPGESGLLALDWWNGNRSVLVNNELSGLIVGLTLQTKPEEIMRALVEATAFGTRVIFDNFREHGVEIRRFIAAGGVPKKDPFTMQLFADVLGMPIEVSGSGQAPALGDAIHAAAVAGRAAGGYGSVAEAAAAMRADICRVYTPDAAAGKIYGELYAEYRKLHDWFGRGGSDVMARLRKIHG